MSEQANIKTVQGIYDAFVEGEVNAILLRIDPDVEWTNAGPEVIPYARKRSGVSAVAAFFDTLHDSVDVQSFQPREFIASGDRVIVLGAWSGRAKPTGKTFESNWTMSWTVKAGKVTAFRSFEDTHAVAAAFSEA